jgi:hypothetical protein
VSGLRELLEQATPGRWFWDSYGRVWQSRNAADPELDDDLDLIPVAVVSTGYDGTPWTPTGKADADLIALAPQLAELVLEAEEVLRQCHDGMYGHVSEQGLEETGAWLTRYRELSER